jgi:hypothetical protein
MQRLPSSKTMPLALNASTSLSNGAPAHHAPHRQVDYPSLGHPPPVHHLQRPPLAQLPATTSYTNLHAANAYPTSKLAPQNRRLSSSTYMGSMTGSTIASKIPLDWRDGVVGLTGLKNLGNSELVFVCIRVTEDDPQPAT